MGRRQSIYTLVSIYVGTVIGAGFASGQEILQFFGQYGKRGIWGILLMTFLLSFIGAFVLDQVYRKKIKTFEDFSTIYLGKRGSDYFNLLLVFLLFVSYFVMLSGSGAVIQENFNLPIIFGIIIMAAATFVVFIFGVRGIAKANNLVVPLLIVVILLITLIVIYNNQMIFSNFQGESRWIGDREENHHPIRGLVIYLMENLDWFWTSLIYVSYNSITAMVVMCSLYPLIADQRAAVIGGILGGLGLGVLALAILLSLLVLYTDIIGLEVPMIAVAHSLGNVGKQVYSFILLLAMFTTAIANGYGCILRIKEFTGIHEKIISFLLVCLSIPLATLGFKKLVAFFYPLFGYMGLVFLVIIFFKKGTTSL